MKRRGLWGTAGVEVLRASKGLGEEEPGKGDAPDAAVCGIGGFGRGWAAGRPGGYQKLKQIGKPGPGAKGLLPCKQT